MKLNEEQKELLKKIGIKWDDQTRPNLTNEQLNKVIQEDKTLGEFIKENQETLKMIETVKFIEKNAGLFMEYFDDLASIKYGKVDPRPITVRFALANYILERDGHKKLDDYAIWNLSDRLYWLKEINRNIIF